MTTLSPGALDMLWEGAQALKRSRATARVHHREYRLMSRALLAKNLQGYLAWAWTLRHPSPDSKEAVGAAVAAEKPAWGQRLEKLFDTVQALEAMSDEDFRWSSIEDEVPTDGQEVLYFFDVVGTHPGHYEANDHAEAFSMDTFVGDFSGFLSGDVTHWMPRPFLHIPPEKSIQTSAETVV